MGNIYEGKNWRIVATHKTGKLEKNDVTVTVAKDVDGTETDLKTFKEKIAKNGTFKVTYTSENVADDKPNTKLVAYAEYGKFIGKTKRKKLTDTCTVWPTTLTLKVVDQEGKKLPDFEMTAKQGTNDLVVAATNADGKTTVDMKRSSSRVKLEGVAPYEILKTTKDKLREWTLTGRRNFVPAFVAPLPKVDGSAQKIYVNQTTTTSGLDFNGNEIEIEVGEEEDANGDSGFKDDVIYIQVKFADTASRSARNDPKPALKDADSIASSDTDRKYTGSVKLAVDNGTKKFKVNFGIAGGDTCEVRLSCAKDKFTGPNVPVLKFVNWRKLGYELRYPAALGAKLEAVTLTDGTDAKDYPSGLKSRVDSKLAAVNIEFELLASHEFPDVDATPANMKGIFLPAAYMADATGGNRFVATSGIVDGSVGFSDDDDKKAQTIYVTVCERAFSNGVKRQEGTLVNTSADQTHNWSAGRLFAFNPATGAANLNLAGKKWKAKITLPHLVDTKLLFDSAPGSDDDLNVGALFDESDGKVTAVEWRQNKTLEVAFPAKAAGGGFETALPATEKTKAETFITQLLADDKKLRQAGNEVHIQLTTNTLEDDDSARLAAVKSAMQTKFTAANKKVKFHPGIDDDGNPREGNIATDGTITFPRYDRIKITLNQSGVDIEDYKKTLPGDFAGPTENAAKCKVEVGYLFFSSGEINGNAGSGLQLMVLRDTALGACSETVCHELGHSMGMTVVPGQRNDLVPAGMPAVKHVDNGGTYYFDAASGFGSGGKRNLHRGPHCAHACPPVNLTHESFNGWAPTNAAQGCIMWGSGGSDETRTAFCADCTKLIKARRLDDVRKPWAGASRPAGG